MSDHDKARRPGVADYPLAEKRPEWVRTATGKALDDLTLDSVRAGEVTLADLAITPQALLDQAQIAQAAGRSTLARNFERAAELVGVPNEVLLAIYEKLRPGRATSRAELLERASFLRSEYGAERMAVFIEEAAEVYERRGLFSKRF
jgi:propanediol dehydratase small subunit